MDVCTDSCALLELLLLLLLIELLFVCVDVMSEFDADRVRVGDTAAWLGEGGRALSSRGMPSSSVGVLLTAVVRWRYMAGREVGGRGQNDTRLELESTTEG